MVNPPPPPPKLKPKGEWVYKPHTTEFGSDTHACTTCNVFVYKEISSLKCLCDLVEEGE